MTNNEFRMAWFDRARLLVDLAVRRLRGSQVPRLDAHLGIAGDATCDAPMARLARTLKVTTTEQAALWVLVAHAFDPGVATQLEGLSDGKDVTLGALARIVYPDHPSCAVSELSREGRLARHGMIRLADPREVPKSWATRAIHVTDDLLALAMDDTDITVSTLASPAIEPLAVGELAISRDALESLDSALRGEGLVMLAGQRSSGRRTAVRWVARQAGVELLEVDAARCDREAVSFMHQLRSVALSCRASGRTPLFCNLDALADEKHERLDLFASEFLPLIDGLVLATCGVKRPTMRCDRPVITIEMGQPTSAQRAKLWHVALGCGTEADAELLAGQYPLAPALIVRSADAARARANGRALAPEDIYAGIRSVLDDRLGQYARRITVTQTWDDLVLPVDQIDCILELMARIRQRRTVYEQWGFAAKVGKGLGVSALFSGPPGTGKTMVAALIARDLGLELYQVDLAKVVSKWIGETEKNLGALFDAAEAGHAILLFDEADALFGKRTDVKSSNDRYANLETNYLLQRLESFTGICLLTSNHDSHIDPAFQRRLSLHVRFELPEPEERVQLWRAMLPAAAPVAPQLDFTSLAQRFAMSGGYIRNAALRAAFLAADEGSAITAAHLERAARVEYEGMGKLAA